ncbi:MAG: SIMPL domain-containing protein [Candidatus Zixiibacteriota bacterium]|nr:MAG: SIMPL domain-containing protein [candidate division Zixibacteria bacterium]
MKYPIPAFLILLAIILASTIPIRMSFAQIYDQMGTVNIRTITVSGEAEVKVQPDEAYITFNVQSYDKKLERAKSENDLELSRIRAIIESFEVDTANIQVDYIRFQPDYKDWRGDKIDKYGIIKSLNFTLKDINSLDTLLTLLINNSTIRNLDVELGVKDISRYEDQARIDAIKAAGAKAESMASQLGLKVGKAYSVYENKPEEYEYDWRYPGRLYSRGGRGVSDILSFSYASLGGDYEPFTAGSGKIVIASSVTISFELE